MSNPVSLFERLNKERPKQIDAEKPKIEILPNPTSVDQYGQDKSGQDKTGQDKISSDKYGIDKIRQDKTGQDSVKQNRNVEISPTKNFTKTSNSIVKLAVPEKYFRGQSKHTYDVLYQRTRGAIVPVRQIQLSKTELVRLTGLAEKTVQLHIRYLRDSNLIAVHPQMGSRSGWIYEVFVPEELNNPIESGQDKISMDKTGMDKTGRDKSGQNLSSYTMQNLSILDHTNPIENKGFNESLKTSLKTNTKIDDEPFGAMLEVLTKACEKVSGRVPRSSDKEKWKEFAELIAMELEIAAVRTGSISSVPSFLTEHLRRRLLQKTSPQKLKTSRPLAPKSSVATAQIAYEAEPLSEQGREVVLKTFKEYIDKGQRDFVMSFEDTYAKDDWTFLMKNLN